ncbi:MAG: Gfo/Idh/MocA family oxidoreductase [Candidatus Rokubacteria bacterium]|nr:Gfo/Idh/MocA family oxidoreductase [Candidatus Rokubacteria bacterium]
MTPTRVLLIGLGRWGAEHLRVLGELGAEVWVAEVDAGRRHAAVHGGLDPARVVADFRAALPHVTAADLVTPADSHRAIAEECLRAGVDCFIEKPLALTAADGEGIARAAADAGRFVQVGHIFRFHAVTAVLRERVSALGPIRYATGRFAGFKRPRADVGVTQTDAIHLFDLFRYLLGRPATAVTATLRDYLGRGMDDCAFASVEYGDVTAFVEVGYFAPGTYRDCVIVGEAATLAADFATAEVRVHANRHVRSGGGWQAPDGEMTSEKAHGPEPLRRELELFLDAVHRRTPPPVDVHDGIEALRTVEAARRSSDIGRRVAIDAVRAREGRR